MSWIITHHYLTVDDDGASVVETERRTVNDPDEIGDAVADMVASPGGRSGTTIAITVSLDGSTSI